ncbi:MAG: 16S rRNA (cytidine(1402)-2'-O)-methyltransferase [Streptomycetaceae bacterium]|nr:MAG: 16S rRNA (cytidine(1402)-2'-O)-methyltransferase [Streptomycetaceae bacterium]
MSLILAGTPLGNPKDASSRLIAAIEAAAVIAAEDSRKFHRLCKDLDVRFSGRVISFFEGNETERTQELLNILKSGADVLVVSDAGMPTVSDPGFRLMRDAIAAGISVSVIPGPSAVTMAIALSGLPTDRFIFEGFSPRAAGAREKFFSNLRHEERTIVWFEAPHRLQESLTDAVEVFGSDRLAVMCREMTKTYEETIRGTLAELLAWSSTNEVLGEITMVLAGAPMDAAVTSASAMVARVGEFEAAGMDRKAAIATVAEELNLSKREVFAAMVDAKSTSKIPT